VDHIVCGADNTLNERASVDPTGSRPVWNAVVKFTLTYDGSLPSSGNKPKNNDKWRIRKELDPQLKDLWASHPAMRMVEENRYFPKTGGTTLTQVHHLHPGPILPPTQFTMGGDFVFSSGGERELLDLCEPINKHGAWFRPLVRDSYALHCGLKISFLRKEPPGKVYQGGDIRAGLKNLNRTISGVSA
jgi:hypothetical protein